jgi:hypothetical protein
MLKSLLLYILHTDNVVTPTVLNRESLAVV